MGLWLLSSGGQASVEGDVEGVEGCLPPVGPALSGGAFRVQVHDGQVDAFECGGLGREVASGLDRAADARVDRFDGVGRVGDPAYLGVEGREGNELSPGVGPQSDDRRVALAPGFGEPVERGLLAGRGVDRFEVFGQLGLVLPGGVGERVPEKRDHAALDDGLRPQLADRVGKVFHPVAHDDQNVGHTTVVQLRQHTQPVLRALPARGAGDRGSLPGLVRLSPSA